MQKRRILRIWIQINPLDPHWIHNPFLDFIKETKNPILDSESGLGFFPKKCTLIVASGWIDCSYNIFGLAWRLHYTV